MIAPYGSWLRGWWDNITTVLWLYVIYFPSKLQKEVFMCTQMAKVILVTSVVACIIVFGLPQMGDAETVYTSLIKTRDETSADPVFSCLISNVSKKDLAVDVRAVKADGSILDEFIDQTLLVDESRNFQFNNDGSSLLRCEFEFKGDINLVRAMACALSSAAGRCLTTSEAR